MTPGSSAGRVGMEHLDLNSEVQPFRGIDPTRSSMGLKIRRLPTRGNLPFTDEADLAPPPPPPPTPARREVAPRLVVGHSKVRAGGGSAFGG
ncbi:hypothetical protein C2845_PM07G38870 [Panicum miliaceum]|uniref:Uncharacterized protein n=1 Tax=Panicum miliaceum TaxID=4540 RepID=A0A3L6SQ36_PANMI|nr:hypothetical protein C2845_PM07G38870 [Panicum miliaceum]